MSNSYVLHPTRAGLRAVINLVRVGCAHRFASSKCAFVLAIPITALVVDPVLDFGYR